MQKPQMRAKTKAGVVACRPAAGGGFELLLVSARVDPDTWVFPVGTVDPGEAPREAAARECVEESGYVVDVGVRVRQLELRRKENQRIDHFIFYLARLRGETAVYEYDRTRRWVPAAKAAAAVVPVFREVAETAVALLPQQSAWLNAAQ